MKVELRKVLRQEVKEVIELRPKSIVEERILPQTLDDIADWTAELIGKLTTLDVSDKGDIEDECFGRIYDALIQETIRQLSETQKINSKKLTK